MRKIYMFPLFIFCVVIAHGQYSLTTANYTQNFNSLANSGTSNLVPTGWTFLETGSGSNTDYTATNGGTTVGDTYSFGSIAAADRAFGSLQSNTLTPVIGFHFTNNTGSTITSLAISYTGEQWRLGATARADRLDFQYSTDATSLSSGSWTDVNTLDFTTAFTTNPTGAVDGNTNTYRAGIINTIAGLTIANGATFFIRWVDLDITGAEDGLAIDDFSLTAGFIASSTDHFRSATTGAWNDLSTWESSPDNVTWVAATSLPTSSANIITICNGHTVTLTASTSADQLVIQNGGTLVYSASTFTIDNGTGDDVIIQSGGIFELANVPPTFVPGATARVSQGSTLKVTAAGGGMSGNGTGVNATNFIYEHQSVLEWSANLFFSTSNVTYFPNVDAVTIPVFKTTNINALNVGAIDPTIFNGIFECAGANINWQNAGTKTFRNGIRGSGTVDGFTSGTSGTFIINGETAELGGSGIILTPSTGLNIGGGTNTIVTVTSNKLINGLITLLPNSYVRLGNFDLMVTNPITSGDVTRHVVTNGTGRLAYANTTTAMFPIGHDDTHYNPVTINGGGGNVFYTRVENGINPSIAFPAQAINKTWHVAASTVVSSVSLTFQYNMIDVSPGITPHPQPLELLTSIGGAWSLYPGNINLNPAGVDPYTITSLSNININLTDQVFALGRSGGYVLPIDFFVTAAARKQNNNAIIKWKVSDTDDIINFGIQRHSNGVFQTIATVQPITNQLEYVFTDLSIPRGTSLYRIKVNRRNSNERYSNTVAVINDSRDVVINGIDPNPVAGITTLSVSTGRATRIEFILTDMLGRVIRKWKESLSEGVNTLDLDATALPAGTYILGGAANGTPISSLRFAKQ